MRKAKLKAFSKIRATKTKDNDYEVYTTEEVLKMPNLHSIMYKRIEETPVKENTIVGWVKDIHYADKNKTFTQVFFDEVHWV